MRVRITIPAEPIAQGRPRFSNYGGFVRAFDPKKSKDWKAFVADFAQKAMDEAGIEKPLDGPLCIRARFAFPLPKSSWRKRTPKPREYHKKRPDLDNLYKGVSDAMEGIVFHRDAEVSKIVMDKITVAQGDAPFVSIIVESLEEFTTS